MYENFEKLHPINMENTDIYRKHSFIPNSYMPVYDSIARYDLFSPPVLSPIVFTGWQDETLAWQLTCAITANLNPTPACIVKGPDAIKFLKKNMVNNFDKFPIGSSKHGIICTERGNMSTNGVIMRTAEDTFELHWLSPQINTAFMEEDYDATMEDITSKHFIFQLFGPKSLEIIEEVTDEDLHDIKFCRIHHSAICGKPVRILRFGMTGGLGYEIHGNTEDARAIHYEIIIKGNPYGIRLLGWSSYMMSHTPGGSQQFGLHYVQDMDEKVLNAMMAMGTENSENAQTQFIYNGSAGGDLEKLHKNPFEMGLGKIIDFKHDFVGKNVLEAYRDNQKRTMVTLKWNADDIADVYASQFRDEEPYFPFGNPGQIGIVNGKVEISFDLVFNTNGKEIGVSGGRTVSYFHRAMLSLASIDLEYTELETEVIVLWGDLGSKQKKIRATVAPMPYNTNYSNKTFDVNNIPRLKDKHQIK